MTERKKLIHTADNHQKRFWCGEEELVVWRNVLLYRYSAVQHSLKLQVEDYDEFDQKLGLPSLQWMTKAPNALAKTTIRIFANSTKKVTITLYFKSVRNAGTLLCQGKSCEDWDVEECEHLKEIVSSFLQNKDTERLTASARSIPVSFVQELGSLLPSTPTIDPASLSSPVSTSSVPSLFSLASRVHIQQRRSPFSLHLTPPPASSGHLTLSCDYTPVGVTLHPPTPSLTKQQPLTTDSSPKSHKSTPLGRKLKSRKRALYFNRSKRSTPQVPIQTYHLKYKQLEGEVEDLASSHHVMKENLISKIEDAKIATKNELKSFISSKNDALCSRIDEIIQRNVSHLQDSINVLSKENQSLKSIVGTIRNEIKHLRTKPPTLEVSTQCSYEEPTPSSNHKPSPTCISVAVQTPAQQEMLSQSHCTDEKNPTNASPEQPENDSSPLANRPTSTLVHAMGAQHHSHDVSKSPQKPDSSPRGCGSGQDQHQQSVTDKDLGTCNEKVVYSIPVSNHFDSLSLEHSTEKVNSADHLKDYQNDTLSKSAPEKKGNEPRSPGEIMMNISVQKRTTALLIGDSAVKHVEPRRLALRSYNLQKVCVSGMTTTDLRQWLNNQPQDHSMKAVVIHVGINDCPSGPVTEKQWLDITQLCQNTYPSARIAFSSLIPAKGMQNINNSILPANRNLKNACMHSHATFIDNTNTFTAPSGAPKQAMYYDSTHPSAKGTAKLASSVKSTLIDWIADALPHRREHQSNQTHSVDRQRHYIPVREQQNTHPEDWLHHNRNFRNDPPLGQYDYTRNNLHKAYEGIDSAESNIPQDRATRWQPPYHTAPQHHVNSDRYHLQENAQEQNRKPYPFPPPISSTHHFPVLNRQKMDHSIPHGITSPSLSSFQIRAPESQNEFRGDNHTNILPSQQSNDPTAFNQPLTQTDMNRYFHILNMMTARMLNMPPNPMNGSG